MASVLPNDCALFLFTRFPQPGRTKTRLIPALGAVGAASLQRQMTEHLLGRFQRFYFQRSLQVFFTGGTTQQMRNWLGNEVRLTPQAKGGLGERLKFALSQGFADGLQRIVVVGSDCPDLDERQIMRALALLEDHDVVLGPATDGGYYLIGLKQFHQPLFENIPWSTERVWETTQAIATHHGLSVALLNPLWDIDRPEDLPLWDNARNVSQKVLATDPRARCTGEPGELAVHRLAAHR
ncbi:MAG: TIGR04282 family arsenosugar biosynthesis glycosyltransferase [Phormidesmis sp.]